MSSLADLIGARFGTETCLGQGLPDDSLLATILARRTYRSYSDQEVPAELISVLLACAQSAPAKSDLQQYSIIEINDAAAKTRLARLAETPFMADAPVVLIFCGDIRRAQGIAALRGHAYGQNTLDSFMNAAVDAALAMQTFILAAESQGLGCCAISHVRNHLVEAADLLALPPGVFPLAGLTAGWPAEERDITVRLPPSVVVHENKYDDSDLPREIDAYDRRRHEIRPIPASSHLHTDEFETPPFYGWSENAARRLSRPEGLEGLRPFLKAHGFALT
jgi:nitroreductase/FMN reductase [NAD(P)H]